MRCHVCDKALTDKEVVFNKDLVNPDGSGGYEPCTVCLEVAMDAAFSQGHKRPDDHEIPEELGDEYGDGELENFEEDETLGLGDASDVFVRQEIDYYDYNQ